jgi:ribose transport system substrate-binding protein
MKLRAGFSACLLFALTALAAASVGTAAPPKVTVAFVGADLVDPYYQTQKCGAFAAAKKFNVNLSWQGVDGVDFAPEVTAFNAVVQKNPQAIVLVPFSSTAFMQPVAAAMKKGIKVITDDAALAKPIELRNVRTDNVRLGGLAADAMAKFLPNKTGEVAIVSFAAEVPVQADRVNGFKNRIKAAYPNIKVVAVEYGGADAAKAAQKTAALLQRYPDLGGVFGTDTNDAEGVGAAVQAAGKRGKVRVIAYDAGPKLVSELKSGLVDALAAQDPYAAAYHSVRLAAAAVRGQIKPGGKPFWVKTGGFVITRDNISTKTAQKFLYRPVCSS